MRMRNLYPLLIATLFPVWSCPLLPPKADDSSKARETEVEPSTWTGERDPEWSAVKALEEQQKYKAATEQVEGILQKARDQSNPEAITRALVRLTQLGMALHGYETSVERLRTEAWPNDLLSITVLNLYYAQALSNYAQDYSWEIRQRERIASKSDTLDLKRWTMDEIVEEANRAFFEAWRLREALGEYAVKTVDEFLTINTYPRNIRGTVRDAVSYLWAELIVNTAYWRPNHANEVYRLDLATLLTEREPTEEEALDLSNPKVHPLRKLASLLSDLETWHTDRKELEASLEAHLERVRIFARHFTQPEQKTYLREHLIRKLETYRDLPWYAVGEAEVARQFMASKGQNAMVEARTAALRGVKAHPESLGGLQCQNILNSIEAPFLEVQGMFSDGAKQRSVLVQHKNLSKVWFRAWRSDVKTHLSKTGSYNNPTPSREDVEALIEQGMKPDAQWSVSLPETPDYETHLSYTTPPMTKPGLYVIAASANPDFSLSNNTLLGLPFILSDLVLLISNPPNGIAVEVRSGTKGKKVVGARVELHELDWRRPPKRVASERTGRDGVANFKAAEPKSYLVLASKGSDTTLHPNPIGHGYPTSDPKQTRALMYTDRSIYRPGQKIQWKALAWTGRQKGGKLKAWSGGSFEVLLRDANGEVVEQVAVKSNQFGTAVGSFVIPSGRTLGRWILESSLGGVNAFLRIEEYKRPTFEVSFLEADKPLRLNHPAVLKGEARYYFGLPVTSGKVRYTVTRTPIYPFWWSWYFPRTTARQQIVASGETILDANGQFEVAFMPAADAKRSSGRERALTYRYSLEAEVTDEGGETREALSSTRVGFSAVEASLTTAKTFFYSTEPAALNLFRSDLNGAPQTGEAQWKLVKLVQPKVAVMPSEVPVKPDPFGPKLLTEGDRLRPRWTKDYQVRARLARWLDGDQLDTGTITHPDSGGAQIALQPMKSGAYRLHYETEDAFGAKYQTHIDFVVADSKTDLKLPAIMMAEASTVHVGSKLRLLVHSGLSDQTMSLDLWHGGERKERRWIQSGKSSSVVEIPVEEQHRGGLGITLNLVRDHQLIQLSETIMVPWDSRALKVNFSTFRDQLRPGQSETWTIQVESADNAALKAAEVLAYMYDSSLDAFVDHRPPSPLNLYPFTAYTQLLQTSLGLATIYGLAYPDSLGPSYSNPSPDRIHFYASYGIGGTGRLRSGYVSSARRGPALRQSTASAMEDMMVPDELDGPVEGNAAPPASPSSTAVSSLILEEDAPEPAKPPVEVRSNFQETAFWQPQLRTDGDGKASISFEVPDSVTSWNVWLHAVTEDLSSGFVQKETKTVKDLMVRPYLPRFLREGDEAEIKVVVNNASEQTIEGELSLKLYDPETEASRLADFGLRADDVQGRRFEVSPSQSTSRPRNF